MMLTLRAEMAELGRLNDWADARIAALALGERDAYAVRLCLEELAGNALLHGSARALHITLEAPPLRLVIANDGPPFDPSLVPEPARPTTLDDARPGGLGLLLTRRYSRALGYERADGWNRITVAF